MEIYIILGALAAFIAICTFIFTIGKRMWDFIRKLADFLSDWFGAEARPGVSRRAGVMERLDNQDTILASHTTQLGTISTRLEVVEGELSPNSGSSLKDAVSRIDKTVHENL